MRAGRRGGRLELPVHGPETAVVGAAMTIGLLFLMLGGGRGAEVHGPGPRREAAPRVLRVQPVAQPAAAPTAWSGGPAVALRE